MLSAGPCQRGTFKIPLMVEMITAEKQRKISGMKEKERSKAQAAKMKRSRSSVAAETAFTKPLAAKLIIPQHTYQNADEKADAQLCQ